MTDSPEIPRVLESLAGDDAFVALATGLRPAEAPLDTLARLAWNVIAEPGDAVANRLVTSLGPVDALHIAERGSEAVASERSQELREAIERWEPRANARTISPSLRNAARTDASLLLPGDPAWPSGVDDLGDHAPIMLWARGQIDAQPLRGTTVALVGARSATPYGSAVASELGAELSERGLTVVSGGAYGIDAAAHRAAIRTGGVTVAYLAGGIDRVYPEGNRQLFNEMLENGAILSEVSCGTAPTRWRFLARNRLIAAASATVVVEAGWRSGSLNTAGHAASLGRPLGAVPGPITSSTSAGCHRLLRDYDAACITGTADVLGLLGHNDGALFSAPSDPRATRVLDAMSARTARTVIDIAARSGLSERDARGLLALLELEGRVASREPGWVRL